ncbi:MAG: hypothetical protein HZB25_05905 [Candidatus Eisenbacteria bacterium]|nr:hypothetical protein [Candidatus Eisenbacteria bacterium]
MSLKTRLQACAVNLTLMIVPLGVLFLVVEGILRLGPPLPAERIPPRPTGALIRCDPDSLLGWRLPASTSGTFMCNEYRIQLRTSAWGLRGPEVNPADLAPLRILVLGDSYAFGWGVSDEDAFPRRLESLLRARAPGRPVEVINAGVPGYAFHQRLRMLGLIRARVRVDIVILTASMANDPWEDLRIAPYLGSHLPWYSGDWKHPDSFLARMIRRSRLLTILDRKSRGLQLALVNISPPATREMGRAMGLLIDECRRDHIPVLTVICPRRSEVEGGSGFLHRLSLVLTKGARDETLRVLGSRRVPVLDITPVLAGLERREGAFLKRDPHWTSHGQQEVAAAVFAALPPEWLAARSGD